MQSKPDTTEAELDLEPDVIEELARVARGIQLVAQMTKWGFVQDYCENALGDIKKAIKAACGHE
jgi:hypothetical protein